MRRRDGTLALVTGSSRSGKTYWTAQQVASARRLLVWDSLGEWADRYRCVPVTDARALADAVKPGAAWARLAYHVPTRPESFELFCRLAWVYIRAHSGACVVVEELSSVTQPGKAPPAWGDLVRQGLRHGPAIYAITQRPAESDKTIIGNASAIHCHVMRFPRDRAYMAEALDVPVSELAALRGHQWIERDARWQLRRGGKV